MMGQDATARGATANGWSIEQARELYHVNGWGGPYFDVNEEGHVQITPDPRRAHRLDLHELINDLVDKGYDLPLLLRFSDILEHRIARLNECFEKAIQEYDYPEVYRGVYPVKVNQQRHVVQEIVEYGRPWSFGLEAGSKPELLIALASMKGSGGLLICNGYKDAKYIETALLAQRLGSKVVVVLEQLEELELVLEASKRLGLEPLIGVRARLTARGVGRWSESTGDRAKFGLTSAEIVHVVDELAARGMSACLQLLHFHIGSQISSILALKNALREATHFYTELAKLGCNMRYLDVGGGLAIDYDGSRTDFHASKNYTMQEYAYDVVAIVQETCQQADVKPPILVSESGRAIVAHQSVLVFEVLGVGQTEYDEPKELVSNHPLLRNMLETWESIQPKNLQEAWHDASQGRNEAQSLFQFGYLSLRELAQIERLFWNCCEKIKRTLPLAASVPEELASFEYQFASKYFCNFSLFQSIPDSWAIDQLFPVMPIHRLEEKPTELGTIADLTCDSEGVINHFIDAKDVKKAIELHPLRPGEPYLIGVFLTGAYQEILGDLHNLFGDTNAVHVKVGEEGVELSHIVRGDTVTDVLSYTQYDAKVMLEQVRHRAEQSLREGRLTIPQMRLLMRHYQESLNGYTYLGAEHAALSGPSKITKQSIPAI